MSRFISDAIEEAAKGPSRSSKRIKRYMRLCQALVHVLYSGGCCTIKKGFFEKRVGFLDIQKMAQEAKERLPRFWVNEDGEWQFRTPSETNSWCYQEIEIAEWVTPKEARGYV